MLIQRIRELNRATPFEPYSVRVTNGSVYPVPHPDFILVSPKGGWVDIADENDNAHFISAIHIMEVILQGARSGKT